MFRDLKIIELASVLAGPTVGSFFAELGALVIKVENPNTNGDVTRRWKLDSENPERAISAYYASANYGKEVIFYDLKKGEDLKKLYTLVETADIIITNYKKGDAEKLKVSYNNFKTINDQIIYGKITAFGNDDKRIGYDLIAQAESGFIAMNRSAESGPLKMPVALMDLMVAHQLKEGLLCALLKREKKGTGSLVSVSLYDAALSSLANQASNFLMEGFIPRSGGSLHPNIAPYGETFKTADDKTLMLAIANNKQFELFAKLLGLGELAKDKRFNTNQKRVQNRNKLFNNLKEAIQKQSSSVFETWIDKYNLPLGFVKNMQEVMESPKAERLILNENIEGHQTKRIKNAIFEIK